MGQAHLQRGERVQAINDLDAVGVQEQAAQARTALQAADAFERRLSHPQILQERAGMQPHKARHALLQRAAQHNCSNREPACIFKQSN